MIYFTAGIAAFTGIIEAFFVKDYLKLSPENLAALGFWVGIPWAMKAPFGQLVDKFWKYKAGLVYIGAALMAGSIGIMVGLTDNAWREVMIRFMSAEAWYVLACVLSPFGFILQDVVADALTVEAVPKVDDPALSKRLHTTMQTLGRVAQVGGSALVVGLGGWLAVIYSYSTLYAWSLLMPVISVSGVILARFMKMNTRAEGITKCDPMIWLGGGAFFAVAAILGLSNIPLREEIIFLTLFGIYAFLMHRVVQCLPSIKRWELVLMAVMIFCFRMTPYCGAGLVWWEIDALGFDESFNGTLAQTGSIVAILGMFALRGWMARRPIPYLIVFLTAYSALMFLPYMGMFYGLHEWTQATLGFGARHIALVDTVGGSALAAVAMIPMLTWIAQEAPVAQKATYFAVMAGFSNLALSASSLGTKYLNTIFIIKQGQYEQLGGLMWTALILGVVIPVAAVVICQEILRRRRLWE